MYVGARARGEGGNSSLPSLDVTMKIAETSRRRERRGIGEALACIYSTRCRPSCDHVDTQ